MITAFREFITASAVPCQSHLNISKPRPKATNSPKRGQSLIGDNTESSEEAKAWAEADPAVKAGWLIVEIRPWLAPKEVWP